MLHSRPLDVHNVRLRLGECRMSSQLWAPTNEHPRRRQVETVHWKEAKNNGYQNRPWIFRYWNAIHAKRNEEMSNRQRQVLRLPDRSTRVCFLLLPCSAKSSQYSSPTCHIRILWLCRRRSRGCILLPACAFWLLCFGFSYQALETLTAGLGAEVFVKSLFACIAAPASPSDAIAQSACAFV